MCDVPKLVFSSIFFGLVVVACGLEFGNSPQFSMETYYRRLGSSFLIKTQLHSLRKTNREILPLKNNGKER